MQVNVVEILMNCYDNVSDIYFDSGFIFNFEYLTKDKGKLFAIQDDV